MNQFFNISRFGRLFSKHTTEHIGSYLLATGVLLAGIGLVLGFVAYLAAPGPLVPDMQAAIFSMGLLAAGTFFTSTVFASFGDNRQATAALLLPASHWEKYLVGWLYALPIFLAVYVGCFYLVDALVMQVKGMFDAPAPLVRLFSNKPMCFSLVLYAAVNAVFLWGSIFFRKQHFVRTAFGFLIGAVVVSLVNMQVVQGLVGRELSGVLPFAGMSFREGQEWQSVNLAPTQNSWFVLVPLGLMLLAWAAAYRRMTEKQL